MAVVLDNPPAGSRVGPGIAISIHTTISPPSTSVWNIALFITVGGTEFDLVLAEKAWQAGSQLIVLGVQDNLILTPQNPLIGLADGAACTLRCRLNNGVPPVLQDTGSFAMTWDAVSGAPHLIQYWLTNGYKLGDVPLILAAVKQTYRTA